MRRDPRDAARARRARSPGPVAGIGVVLAWGVLACGDGASSPDASVEPPAADAALDGALPDAAAPDAAPPDAASPDAVPPDAAPLDVGVLPTWVTGDGVPSSPYQRDARVLALPTGRDFVLAYARTGIDDRCVITRQRVGGPWTTLVDRLGFGCGPLVGDGGEALLAAFTPRVAVDVELDELDAATPAVVRRFVAQTALQGHAIDDVRRGGGTIAAVGTGFWRIASDGTTTTVPVFATPPSADVAEVAFLPGAPERIAIASSSGVQVVEVATATAAAVALPPGFALPAVTTHTNLVVGDRAWLVGAVGSDVALVPLGDAVATVLPYRSAAARVLADGRVLVVAMADATSMVALRLDPARFDGADGASRLDPTFGTGGVVRLSACAQPPCGPPPGAPTQGLVLRGVDDLVVLADGTLVVLAVVERYDLAPYACLDVLAYALP